jgi:hypothetical protein
VLGADRPARRPPGRPGTPRAGLVHAFWRPAGGSTRTALRGWGRATTGPWSPATTPKRRAALAPRPLGGADPQGPRGRPGARRHPSAQDAKGSARPPDPRRDDRAAAAQPTIQGRKRRARVATALTPPDPKPHSAAASAGAAASAADGHAIPSTAITSALRHRAIGRPAVAKRSLDRLKSHAIRRGSLRDARAAHCLGAPAGAGASPAACRAIRRPRGADGAAVARLTAAASPARLPVPMAPRPG